MTENKKRLKRLKSDLKLLTRKKSKRVLSSSTSRAFSSPSGSRSDDTWSDSRSEGESIPNFADLVNQVESRRNEDDPYIERLSTLTNKTNRLINRLSTLSHNGGNGINNVLNSLDIQANRLRQHLDQRDLESLSVQRHREIYTHAREIYDQAVNEMENDVHHHQGPQKRSKFGGVGLSRPLARIPYLNDPDPDDNVDWNPLPPDHANFLNRMIPRVPVILETGPERRARFAAALRRQQARIAQLDLERGHNPSTRRQGPRRWRI